MKLAGILMVMLLGNISVAGYLPENCEDLGGYVVAQVTSTQVDDLDGNQSVCTFKVQAHHGNSTIDYNCPIDLYDVDAATYVDPNCSVQTGDLFNHSATQTFNTKDMTSRGLFYWITLGGYQSEIVFPNYGK